MIADFHHVSNKILLYNIFAKSYQVHQKDLKTCNKVESPSNYWIL
jgi:hypothetical protein